MSTAIGGMGPLQNFSQVIFSWGPGACAAKRTAWLAWLPSCAEARGAAATNAR
eukprot:CAMPEP_0113823352 /NCGR_PEP_ID=MMETSP0328-20130328/2699_1 /TAXON_ID=39455 /ORGANISM="Alexandrium minutum" /LENGTH=52 /DNA_ID=CAMNT_0000791291 /DNA_START=205 /DNA_END=360 /DNA_ORIENTATION=- /assembly_acc=CAM_ASM_000350